MKALGVIALIALVGIGGRLVYRFLVPENLARRPPQFDVLRAAILKETHLEANLEAKQFTDQVDLSARMNVVFPHVPASADKAAIERHVRALVKVHLPLAKEVDVQFGDNLAGPRNQIRPPLEQ
ncbi:MAG: hypothetical protein H6Q89_5206 [Myxococcaceae bacterium]|nr:hypothetical protein [Myxococcaceae bacterium]